MASNILNRFKTAHKGFTIIELMIATAIFSLVMMIIVASIIQVTKMYYRTNTITRSQEIARGVIEEIGESIRFSNDAIDTSGMIASGPNINVGDSDTGYFCIGSRRYSYAVDRQLKSQNPDSSKKERKNVLWVDEPENCSGNGPVNFASLDTDNGRELLAENMRILKLDIKPIAGLRTYNIDIVIAYGDEDLLEIDNGEKLCKIGVPGVEHCYVTKLSVTAEKRL